MSARCPRCRAAIVAGALRCRACGADARRARRDDSLTISFDLDVCSRAAELLQAVHDLSPELAAWLTPSTPRAKRREALMAALAYLDELDSQNR